MLKNGLSIRILSSALVFAVFGSTFSAFASDLSCDAVYEKNIRQIEKAKHDTVHLMKMAVFVDAPEDAGKYAAIRLLQRLGYLTVVGEELGRFVIFEGTGSVIGIIGYGGLIVAANEITLGEYSGAYRLIVQSEEGGGPALEKFHKMLSDENPKWRIPEETFRQIIFDMNHDGMLCTPVAGDTLREMTDYLQGLSDRAVDYWVTKADGRE